MHMCARVCGVRAWGRGRGGTISTQTTGHAATSSLRHNTPDCVRVCATHCGCICVHHCAKADTRAAAAAATAVHADSVVLLAPAAASLLPGAREWAHTWRPAAPAGNAALLCLRSCISSEQSCPNIRAHSVRAQMPLPPQHSTARALPSPATPTHRVDQDLLCCGAANAIDVLQGDLNALAVWDLNVVHTQVLHTQGCTAAGHCHLRSEGKQGENQATALSRLRSGSVHLLSTVCAAAGAVVEALCCWNPLLPCS